jgi:hypothetical protein
LISEIDERPADDYGPFREDFVVTVWTARERASSPTKILRAKRTKTTMTMRE